MADYAKLRTDLVATGAEIDGQTVFNVKDPITGSYFRLREPEYWLIRQLDGETSYEEIAGRFREKFGFDLTADNVVQFVGALEKLFFLDDGRAEQATSRASYNAARGKTFFARMLFVKLKALNPERILHPLVRVYAPFHNRFWAITALTVIAAGIWLFFANLSSFRIDVISLYKASSIAAIIAATFITLMLHEFAHAVTCRHYGGEVREIGFLLMYFQPCFYADLSDAWLFPEKSKRLAVTLAGPFMQFLTFALAVIVWRLTVPGSFPSEVAFVIIVVSGVSVLFNFNPLIKLDGYYLLSDWVEIPNLRSKAFAYLGNWFKRAVLGWPIEPIEVTPRRKRIYLRYAVLATLYSAFLILYVLYLVAKFLLAVAGGWGLLLLTVVLIASLKGSLLALGRGTIQHAKYMRVTLRNPIRLLVYVAVIASIAIGLFAVPFPQRVTGEVVVRPIAEFNLLLNQFGLLEHSLHRRGEAAESKTGFVQMTSTDMASLDLLPLLSDGQLVTAGDTLALLISNQLTTELTANVALLDKYNRELALLRSPPKAEEIAEAEAQVSAAQATLAQLERDLERTRGLRDKDGATKEQYETALSAVEIARAEVKNRIARLDLLKSPPKPEQEAVLQAEIDRQHARVQFLRTQEQAQSIIAPISGTIQIPHADARILSVVDNRTVEVLVPVSDFDIDLVQLDQTVQLKVRSYPQELFEGRVTHIPTGAVESDGDARFFVSVEVPNDAYLLQNGMTGYAKIQIASRSVFVLLARKIASFVRVEFWSWW